MSVPNQGNRNGTVPVGGCNGGIGVYVGWINLDETGWDGWDGGSQVYVCMCVCTEEECEECFGGWWLLVVPVPAEKVNMARYRRWLEECRTCFREARLNRGEVLYVCAGVRRLQGRGDQSRVAWKSRWAHRRQ